MAFYVIEKIWSGIETPVQLLATTDMIDPFPSHFDLGTIDIVRLYAFCRQGDIAHPEKYLWVGKYNETSRGYSPTNIGGQFIEADLYRIKNLGYQPVMNGKEQLSVWAPEGMTTNQVEFTFLLDFSSYLKLKIPNDDHSWSMFGAIPNNTRMNIPESWKIEQFSGNWIIVRIGPLYPED